MCFSGYIQRKQYETKVGIRNVFVCSLNIIRSIISKMQDADKYITQMILKFNDQKMVTIDRNKTAKQEQMFYLKSVKTTNNG